MAKSFFGKDKINTLELNKLIFVYIKKNNLLDNSTKIIKVNNELAMVLNLTETEIKNINNAKTKDDNESLNFYNLFRFITKCFV